MGATTDRQQNQVCNILMRPDRTTMLCCVAATFLSACTLAVRGQAVHVDSRLPRYERSSGVSGDVTSVGSDSIGSDSMNNLMAMWAEAFLRIYPNVRVQIESRGSSTALPALLAGTAQFAPMSRLMRAAEIDQFARTYGYEPTQIPVSYEALAVYVRRDNPLDRLTMAEVDAIFSKSRRRGHERSVRTWGDLGLTGDWAWRPIRPYGLHPASGTYGFFKAATLRGGDYRDDVLAQPGLASVVQAVTQDRYGIAYGRIGYRTSATKVVALAEREGSPYSEGRYEDVRAGRYPLTRVLYLYVNKAPDRPIEPAIREFVKFTLSRDGQEIVVKEGYLPLSGDVVEQQLVLLERGRATTWPAPSPKPTPAPSPKPTPAPSPKPTPAPSPKPTPAPSPKPTPTPTPTSAPSPTPSPTSHSHASPSTPPTANERLDRELKQAWDALIEGRIAYNPQRDMRQCVATEVRVRIAGDPAAAGRLAGGFEASPAIEPLKVSGSMEVELKSAEPGVFEITPLTPTRQAIVPPHSEWTWTVKPLTAGSHALHLSVVAIIKLSDGTSEQKALSKKADISVQVNPGCVVQTFIERNWQWLLGSPVVLGVMARVVAMRRRKKNRQTGAAPPDDSPLT